MAMLQEQIHSVNSLHWYPPSPPRPIAPIIDKAAHGGSGYEKGMLAGDFALFKPNDDMHYTLSAVGLFAAAVVLLFVVTIAQASATKRTPRAHERGAGLDA